MGVSSLFLLQYILSSWPMTSQTNTDQISYEIVATQINYPNGLEKNHNTHRTNKDAPYYLYFARFLMHQTKNMAQKLREIFTSPLESTLRQASRVCFFTS